MSIIRTRASYSRPLKTTTKLIPLNRDNKIKLKIEILELFLDYYDRLSLHFDKNHINATWTCDSSSNPKYPKAIDTLQCCKCRVQFVGKNYKQNEVSVWPNASHLRRDLLVKSTVSTPELKNGMEITLNIIKKNPGLYQLVDNSHSMIDLSSSPVIDKNNFNGIPKGQLVYSNPLDQIGYISKKTPNSISLKFLSGIYTHVDNLVLLLRTHHSTIGRFSQKPTPPTNNLYYKKKYFTSHQKNTKYTTEILHELCNDGYLIQHPFDNQVRYSLDKKKISKVRGVVEKEKNLVSLMRTGWTMI